MKRMLIVFGALLLCFVSVSAIGGDGEIPDYWIYQKTPTGVEIFYNGRPIKFLPDVGDGAFDRAIKIDPVRRYVFLDSRLSLDDASNIVSFWKSLDPKTPTDFVVIINGRSAYRFISKFERVAVPDALMEAVSRIAGSAEKAER